MPQNISLLAEAQRQHVLVMLSGKPTDPGGQFTAASLVQRADGSYGWPDPPPNSAWASSLSTDDAVTLDRMK